MYVPEPFRADDRATVLEVIDAYPFAALITPEGGDVMISHVPLLLSRRERGWGVLSGHVSRANPHWRRFDGERGCVAVFLGPHAYVSPSWYAEGPAVPTWNYLVVHAYGRPTLREDPRETSAHLDELVARHEAAGAIDVPESFRRSLEKGIVGFQLEIERVEAKFKLGQNRSEDDRAGTIRALEQAGETELAAWTRRITADRGPTS